MCVYLIVAMECNSLVASLLDECVYVNGSLRMDDNILTWQKPFVQQPLLLQICNMPATYQDAKCIERCLNMECSKDNLIQLREVLTFYSETAKRLKISLS